MHLVACRNCPGTVLHSHHKQQQQQPQQRARLQLHRAAAPTIFQQCRRRQRVPMQQIRSSSSWGSSSSGSSSSNTPGNGGSTGQPRFAGAFGSGNRDSSSSGGGSSNSSGEDGSRLFASSSAAAAADVPPRWVLVALLPTVLWCITWSLTSGLFSLADCSLSGVVSVARLLFPSGPLMRGVQLEDVAVSLVKGLQGGTDSPDIWSRPGLWLPSWLLRGLMGLLFSLAAGSSDVAVAVMNVPSWLLLSGVCKCLMYGACLLLMLPLGTGLNRLLEAAGRTSRAIKPPRLSDTTLLTLKLAGMLAWPCISGSAVLRPAVLAATEAQTASAAAAAAAAASAAAGPPSTAAAAAAAAASSAAAGAFVGATLQVLVCCGLLVLLLAVAAVAGQFCWQLAARQVSADAVFDFGLQVGLLCGLQGAVNVAQMCLSLAMQTLPLQELAMPVLSTAVLARLSWSVWRLQRIGANVPSLWLQVLSLAPALPAAAASSSSDTPPAGTQQGP